MLHDLYRCHYYLYCSQSDVVTEPNLDIGKLKDPTEFFAAFERMESMLLYYVIMILNLLFKVLTTIE